MDTWDTPFVCLPNEVQHFLQNQKDTVKPEHGAAAFSQSSQVQFIFVLELAHDHCLILPW
jgi:hypothetical protein